MKKTNTKTKLRITNDKIKLINERTPTGAWEDFKDATGAKEVVGIIKNLGGASVAIAKHFGLNILPIKALGKQLKDAVWHGKKFDWDAFKADYKKFAEKGYDQFNKDVDDLVKDHENNFKSMLTSGMGMTEAEANALMFAGSPPVAIMNKLYDLSKDKRKGGDVSNFAKIKQLNELIPKIIYLYITGLNPDKTDGSSALISKIKSQVYNKYMGNLGQNCKEIIEYLHREEYYKRHFEPIQDKCKSIYSKFNFDLNIVESIDRASLVINDAIINQFLEDFKEYCDRNNEKVESYSKKSLNLKTMLIKEADGGDDLTNKKDMTFDQMEVHNFGVVLAFVFIRMNTDEIKKLLIEDVSGFKLDKFNRVLKDKNTIIKNMLAFFTFCLNKKILIGLANEFISDPDFDFKTQGKSYYEITYDDSIKKFDSEYVSFFTSAKEKSHLYKEILNKTGNKATAENMGYAIAHQLNDPTKAENDAMLIKAFNWDKLKSKRVVQRLFETELCNDRDIPFLKAVQQTLNEYEEVTKDNVKKGKNLKDALDKKFNSSDGGSSAGS